MHQYTYLYSIYPIIHDDQIVYIGDSIPIPMTTAYTRMGDAHDDCDVYDGNDDLDVVMYNPPQ